MIIYETALLIFLFQGITLPFIVALVYFICTRQWRRLLALREQSRAGRVRAAFAHSMTTLPSFRPLNCPECGAGMLLDANDVHCSHCQHREALPKDYLRAAVLKGHVQRLLKSALGAWRLARVLTSRVAIGALCVLLFVEPFVLLPIVLTGSGKYPHTIVDDWLAPFQSARLSNIRAGLSLMGGVAWWLGFAMLASLAMNMRKKLPVMPVFTKELHGRETGNCQSCGGGIEYDRGAFATICSYCHVENYRVQFAHSQRRTAEAAQSEAKFALFDALTIANEFLFTVWILGAMCLAAALLLFLKIIVWHWLGWS
jgi:hypothetical protein